MNDAVSTTANLDSQARLDLAAVYRLLAHHGWGVPAYLRMLDRIDPGFRD